MVKLNGMGSNKRDHRKRRRNVKGRVESCKLKAVEV